MYHSFFIYSSIDGHLDCFHVLAIVNSAAMNTGVRVSFSVLVSVVQQIESAICIHILGASLMAHLVKNPTAIQETLVRFLGWEDPLEKG